jgi:hypothetical protein
METIKLKIKEFLTDIKSWGFVEWVVNFRYIGYAVMLVHAMMQHEVTKEEFIGYGAVILMIEYASKSVRKPK